MYAVIATGGKQTRVEVGSRIEVERLGVEVGDEVSFAPVLLVDGEEVLAAASALERAKVSGRVVGESKGPKIIGFTYKAKARGRRRFGHRQHYSTVEITNIATSAKKG
jgi:large subunit ribosomal protein L21